MKQAQIELLQAMPLFGALSAGTIEFLLGHARVLCREPGEYFFREGDEASAMYVLQQGKVELRKNWQGEDFFLKTLGEGESFGEMALIEAHARNASVLALEPCRAIEIGKADLVRLYQHDLEQFTLIQMNMSREISRRLRLADDQIFAARFSGK